MENNFKGLNQQYINKLVEQYKAATGTKHVDLESGEFIKDFSAWLQIRKKTGEQYGQFLAWMDVHPEFDSSSVEVGKGREDSIVLQTEISMITPYFEGLDRTHVKEGNIEVWPKGPVVISGNNAMYLNMENITRLFTQNPYSQGNIRNWELIHNSGYNITVGVFGSLDDKDYGEKIRQIENLKAKMEPGYAEEYASERERYFYAISSSRKVKVNVLTR